MGDLDLFLTTLKGELGAAWETLNTSHPGEKFYAFGLYTNADVERLAVTASTEEALARLVADHVERRGGDPDLWRQALRWRLTDSPLHAEGAGLLPASTALIGPSTLEIAVTALAELDAEGAFGTDGDRARVTLCVWVAEQTDEQCLAFARALNPTPLVGRYLRELHRGVRASLALEV